MGDKSKTIIRRSSRWGTYLLITAVIGLMIVVVPTQVEIRPSVKNAYKMFYVLLALTTISALWAAVVFFINIDAMEKLVVWIAIILSLWMGVQTYDCYRASYIEQQWNMYQGRR